MVTKGQKLDGKWTYLPSSVFYSSEYPYVHCPNDFNMFSVPIPLPKIT